MTVLICPVVSLGATPVGSSNGRPNLIFILSDDQRAEALGVSGNPIIRTPNIDRLAAEGTRFTQAFVTSAICTPSRASYFLGQFERRHGINFNSGTAMAEAAWARSYPVLLREAGYFTGYVGKNHVPIGEGGYESGVIEGSFDYWYAGHNHIRFYVKEVHEIFTNARADTQVEVLEEGVRNFLDPDETFLRGASEFLKARDPTKPFCLSISFNVPHGAATSNMKQRPTDPELYRSGYREFLPDLPLSPRYVAKRDIGDRPRLPFDVLRAEERQHIYDYVDTPAALRERIIREYQTITGIDNLVGNLRAKLAELGLAENTVIIYASDHGIMHGEYGLGGKALNYDPCLRVPFIVMDPRVPTVVQGQVRDEPIMSIDLAPTLLSLADEQVPVSMQGVDLSPIVRGEHPAWRTVTFAENLWSTKNGNPLIESVQTRDWKYIRYFATDRALFAAGVDKPTHFLTSEMVTAYRLWLDVSTDGLAPDYEELFHLAIDPEETCNLAVDVAHTQRLAAMRAECDRQVRAARGPSWVDPLTVPYLQIEAEY